MALCHLPSFSCVSKKLPSSFLSSQPLIWDETKSFPPFKILTVSCSTKKPRDSSKQLKTRPVRSNADLCNDLREFNSMAGLPKNHVPSMKELCQHGRKDLANIVRRRGYKVIAELLMHTTQVETILVRNSAENEDTRNAFGNESSEVQEKRKADLVVDLSSSSKGSMGESNFPHANGSVPVNSEVQISEKFESSISSSLHEKAATFVRNGDLEPVDGTIEVKDMWMSVTSDLGYDIPETNVTDANNLCAELDNELVVGSSQENLVSETNGSSTDSILNGGVKTSVEVALPVKLHTSHRHYVFPSEDMNSTELDNGLADEAGKRGSHIEINHLKAMLHEKEIELSQLKQQIEKEKLDLSNLQEKAYIEIGNAQRIISIKDEELRLAEESLMGLKEMEYRGTGETVEIAGSFNGWHHPIKMDLHQPAETMDQADSSKSILWSTALWLYPGIYEIKFIVDGHWKIDPHREIIMRGNIQNNILRVER